MPSAWQFGRLARCKWLIQEQGLEWDQVYWHYNKWRDLKKKLRQEYPCSAEEVFLSSGRCVFDKESIVLRIEALNKLYKKQPPKIGRFCSFLGPGSGVVCAGGFSLNGVEYNIHNNGKEVVV